MPAPTWRLLLLLILSLSTTACSAALGSGRSRVVDQEIEGLKIRVVELQRQATIDKVEIDRLRQKLAGLEERLDREAEERAAAAARVDAPRGITEEAVPAPRQVTVIEVSDLEEPLDDEPVPVIGEPQGAAPGGGDQADASSAATAARITNAAQAIYDQGYSLFHQGRYVEGEEAFERFLAAYASTDLGDNARYWIGECRLARNELQSALDAFRETVREYPEGNKTPDALLRAAEILERQGDLDGARASYREVERRFPESPARVEAARRLERL